MLSLISCISMRISYFRVSFPSFTASLTMLAIPVVVIWIFELEHGALGRDSTILAKAVLMFINPKSLSSALLDGTRPSKLHGCGVNLT